ncbi:uncharacterized protein [Nicotiana sylvestris]|uniref:uncharacterized protein n=1 Tax=Nicotiana sylvestris TaxID=4096 RepID=UPI00388CDF6F
MFNGTGDPKVHLRTYCDNLVRVGKDEKIRMKLFMRSLIGDALSWYISQNPKKWSNWVSIASDFMDQFRFNTENTPDIFYIQNLKKKPTETFCEYATRWRSEAAKVRPTLDEEQMNKFFVRAQDSQYYERLMVTENHKFLDIIKLRERIEEGIKSGMDKIQTLIDNKVIQAKETAPNVRKCDYIHVIKTNEEWDPEGSIGLIREGDDFKVAVTLTPIVVQTQAPIDVEVTTSVPFEVEVAPPTATSTPFEVEVVTLFIVTVSTTPPFNSKAIPWDYVTEARQKGKTKIEEFDIAQGMTRTGRVYTPEYLGGSSKDVTARQPIIETRPDDLWRKVQAKEYSVIDHLNKVPAQIYILSLLQISEEHKNALMKVLSEAYVPNNITGGEMANMVVQVLKSHNIIFHEDELSPEGLNHNRALHITVQFEEKFIVRVLVDGGSSLNICPLDTLKRLDKVKGQALADHLAENPVGVEYEPLKTYFPDEEISFMGEDITEAYDGWRMFFYGAANFKGVGIGAFLVPEIGQHYPLGAKLRFSCTNNMEEYEACKLGLNMAVDMNIQELLVIGDSDLLVDQELKIRFTKIEFRHVPRIQNEFADALATLSSMIQYPDKNYIDPIPVRIHNQPVYCSYVDGKPWFHDIKEYL